MKRIPWAEFIAALTAALIALLTARQLPTPLVPPVPPPPPAPVAPPATDAKDAIGRLVFSGGYCSATPITALSDGKTQTLLTASHCLKTVGEVCQFFTRGGRMVSCRVTAINREADAGLLVTELLSEPLAYLNLAATTPAAGTDVFQAGWGIDVPGNVERGHVLQRDSGQGQVIYELSVSPGDSGGGICVTASGEVLSPVCCTTNLAAVGQVWGARPEEVHKMIASPASFVDVPPSRMPARSPVKIGQ